MKEKPQEQEQQVHIDPASAQQEPEYSLEDIMNEFGGWSKRETPAEPEAEPQTPAEPPRVWPPEQQAGPEPSAQPGLSGDTIRFTPVAQPAPEGQPGKIGSDKGEAERIAAAPGGVCGPLQALEHPAASFFVAAGLSRHGGNAGFCQRAGRRRRSHGARARAFCGHAGGDAGRHVPGV